LKKLLSWIFWVPVGVILIAIAISNRQIVTFSIDPVAKIDPFFVLNLPLYLLLFAAILFGILFGGVAAWLAQGKWRKNARHMTMEATKWRDEAAHLRESSRRNLPSALSPPSPHNNSKFEKP
jgi:hypothetical protein